MKAQPGYTLTNWDFVEPCPGSFIQDGSYFASSSRLQLRAHALGVDREYLGYQHARLTCWICGVLPRIADSGTSNRFECSPTLHRAFYDAMPRGKEVPR